MSVLDNSVMLSDLNFNPTNPIYMEVGEGVISKWKCARGTGT